MRNNVLKREGFMHTYTLTIQNSKRMLLDEKGNEKESDTDTAFTLTLCYTDPP